MDRGDVMLLAQLVASLDDAVRRLSLDFSAKNAEGVERMKREVLDIQHKIDALL